jgi:LysM repeat protein
VEESRSKPKTKDSAKNAAKPTTLAAKNGDTVTRIASRSDGTPEELKRLSGLRDPGRVNQDQETKLSGDGSRPTKLLKEHIVQRGETVGFLAKKYGVSSSAIMSANNLSSAHVLRAGQALLIPVSGSVTLQEYTVKEGDTLSELAQRFGSDTDQIKNSNHLDDANYLSQGQKLNIPTIQEGSGNQNLAGRWITYVVKKGDTLWDIARAFGVLMEKLMVWNDLGMRSSLQVGDRIRIFLTD